MDEKPRKFVLAKPKNVDPLSNLLGYPDFFQLKADEPEEVLSTVNLANGYCEPNFLAVLTPSTVPVASQTLTLVRAS